VSPLQVQWRLVEPSDVSPLSTFTCAPPKVPKLKAEYQPEPWSRRAQSMIRGLARDALRDSGRLDWRYVVGVVAAATELPQAGLILPQGAIGAVFVHIDGRATASATSPYPMRDLVVAGIHVHLQGMLTTSGQRLSDEMVAVAVGDAASRMGQPGILRAQVHPGNGRSIGLLRRSGFVRVPAARTPGLIDYARRVP
jgi:hypothetical protein